MLICDRNSAVEPSDLVELLENDADVPAPGLGLPAGAAVGLGLLAEQRDAAGGTAVHALEPADEADEGRLAGARGADEADHLALADLELDVVQHGLPAEGQIGRAHV